MHSGHVTDDVTTMTISWSLLSGEVLLTSQALFFSATLTFKCQMSTNNFQITHSNDHQGTLSTFKLIEARSCSELKHLFCHRHVTNDAITLTLI